LARAPGRIRLGLMSFGPSTAVPTVLDRRPLPPARQRRSRWPGPRDGRDRCVIDVGMGSTRTGRFDRVIPTVGLVQVGQGPAMAVVHAPARIGDEDD
jgi:hypothetical protein